MIKRQMDQCVYRDKNFKLKIDEEKIKLGNDVYHKTFKREYKIEKIDELRKVVKKNRKRYRHDLREKRKKLVQIIKTGNRYG